MISSGLTVHGSTVSGRKKAIASMERRAIARRKEVAPIFIPKHYGAEGSGMPFSGTTFSTETVSTGISDSEGYPTSSDGDSDSQEEID